MRERDSLRSPREPGRCGLPALACLLLLGLGLAGCRSVPDLRPFAEATASIDLAANGVHDLVVSDLDSLAASASDSEERKALRKAREAFSTEWGVRLQATEALVGYAGSLASIAEAGEGGAQGARALAGSVNRLLSSIPGVTTQIPAAVTDLASWIKGEVDRVRAAETLADAVARAHPVVRDIGAILAKDFGTVDSKIGGNVFAALAVIDREYGDLPRYREALERRRGAIASSIAKAVDEGAPIPGEQVAEMDTVTSLLDQADSWYGPYRERLELASSRGETGKLAARKAKEAIERWVRLHGEVVDALQERRAPSASVLSNKAMELRALVERLGGGER